MREKFSVGISRSSHKGSRCGKEGWFGNGIGVRLGERLRGRALAWQCGFPGSWPSIKMKGYKKKCLQGEHLLVSVWEEVEQYSREGKGRG